MIQTIVEWIFVDLVYGSFAAMRARRRRRDFRLGKEVKFPGFVLHGPAVTPAARGYLCAIGGKLRSTGQGSPEVASVQIPVPTPGWPIEVAEEVLPPKTWSEQETARYETPSGLVALACRPVDRKLLQMVLEGCLLAAPSSAR